LEHRTVILPIVVYGCEIWCFILREKYRLCVREQGVEGGVEGGVVEVLRVVLREVLREVLWRC